MPVVEAQIATTSPVVRLAADLGRSSIIAHENDTGQHFVVVTADPLRLDRPTLYQEADSEFGICFVIRLTGHAPAIGILRQTERGFREYWRTIAPSARALLRRLQGSVEEANVVPLFWRTDAGDFIEFHLGGYNRQHRVWYSRLDVADPDAPPFVLESSSAGAPPVTPVPYRPE